MRFEIIQFYVVAFFLDRFTLDCVFKCSCCHNRLHRLPVNRGEDALVSLRFQMKRSWCNRALNQSDQQWY